MNGRSLQSCTLKLCTFFQDCLGTRIVKLNTYGGQRCRWSVCTPISFKTASNHCCEPWMVRGHRGRVWRAIAARGGCQRRSVTSFPRHGVGKPQNRCVGALFIAGFHGIRKDFEGSLRKYWDPRAFDGLVSHRGFPNLRCLLLQGTVAFCRVYPG